MVRGGIHIGSCGGGSLWANYYVRQYYVVYVNTITLLYKVIQGYMLRLQPSHLQAYINLLTPNVNYSDRTALLTSKVVFYIFIQQI